MDKFITAKEVTNMLGISIPTLNLWIKGGKFPKPDVGGEVGITRRWKESTYIEWCNSK
ncbi:helix-turn-helix transcriptional regulator [Vibrio harveyi]|uniref:helix-turn-helix transcriptional regulator n=1 Tax=Vibrio harveyi TaxID=669 RepID=UPI00217F0516|nr:hypothetical protein [Vibrio harveyi]